MKPSIRPRLYVVITPPCIEGIGGSHSYLYDNGQIEDSQFEPAPTDLRIAEIDARELNDPGVYMQWLCDIADNILIGEEVTPANVLLALPILYLTARSR